MFYFSLFFLIFIIFYACVSVWVCTVFGGAQWRPQVGVGSPEIGVIDSCELPDMDVSWNILYTVFTV